MSDEQVLSAFKLYKDNLISREIFYETIERIIKGRELYNSNYQGITEGQKNYISRLKMEGKIPATQTLNITKQEAQVLIHNAVNMPNKTEVDVRVPDNEQKLSSQTASSQAQTGSAEILPMSKEEKELYSDVEDY